MKTNSINLPVHEPPSSGIDELLSQLRHSSPFDRLSSDDAAIVRT